jgi:hypothetical protein
VLLLNPKRLLSSNLEIYLEAKINERTVKIIGKPSKELITPRD